MSSKVTILAKTTIAIGLLKADPTLGLYIE